MLLVRLLHWSKHNIGTYMRLLVHGGLVCLRHGPEAGFELGFHLWFQLLACWLWCYRLCCRGIGPRIVHREGTAWLILLRPMHQPRRHLSLHNMRLLGRPGREVGFKMGLHLGFQLSTCWSWCYQLCCRGMWR